MNETLYILGRQPALGRAELESLYGSERVRKFGEQGALVSAPTLQPFVRLGGSIKQTDIIATLDTTDWQRLQDFIRRRLPKLLDLPETGKIQLGMSVFGMKLTTQKLQAAGLELKKALRNQGHSVRLVANKELTLSSAQVLYNHLTGPQGCEIVLYAVNDRVYIARTVAEQNINSYTTRDRERPKRDARVGMLPPKLAQIIINIATSTTKPENAVVLDPFCGTGVVVQEALLMGCQALGTDLEPRMIEYTNKNITWLEQTLSYTGSLGYVEVGDATSYSWTDAGTITAVASETYLGQPLIRLPDEQKLQTIVHTCNQIIKKFLENLGSQIPSGTRLCLAVPAWKRSESRFEHLPLIDQLEVLGYNRVSFVTASREELIYHRENQIVARELLVLTRK